METELQNFTAEYTGASQPALRPAQAAGALPATLTLCECSAANLRAYLDANELSTYRIFEASNSFDLNDITRLLPALGETEAVWELPPAQLRGGQVVSNLTFNETNAWEHPSGFLRLFRHEAVIARWFWFSAAHGDGYLWLVAAPSAAAFATLRRAVLQARREANRKTWQVIGEYNAETRPPRVRPDDAQAALVQPPALLERVRREILGFFEPDVAKMYRDIGVPYRRGVLLYGPPGNGKTSLIRWIGASLPAVSALSLRAWQGFDSDDLLNVINQWTAQAPALLVLEDLDWLLQQVNVSTFLNQLDGLSTESAAGGLLLIATTNHPQKLDAAVNNRPGRFDAMIELPPPDASLRERFLRGKLPALADVSIAKAVAISDGLSFAHLQEVLRLSGLRALHAGRTERTAEDVLMAVNDIKDAHEAATRGFPAGKPEVPFGLAALHKAGR